MIKRRELLGAMAASLMLAACAETRTRQTAGQYIDDATITSKVKTALAQDPDTSAMDISVETYNGVVQLSGFADSTTEKRRAEQVARAVEGVRSVKNDIRVKPR